MTNHQKRLSVPKSWPVERKTRVFTVKASGGPHGDDGVPLVVVLRDVLGYVASTSEAQYALNEDGVLVNGEPASDVRRPIGMFDILSFPARGEHYRVFPDEGGRLGLTPIDADAADSKLSKVEDKTTISGGRTQLNLHDGGNIVVEDDAYAAGDSVVVTPDNDVVAHFEYGEGALVTAVDGRHAGEVGEVTDVTTTPGSSSNTVRVETDDGSFETVGEYVVVIDENFVDDEEAETPGRETETTTTGEPAEAQPREDESAETDGADDSEAESESESGDAGSGDDESAETDTDEEADVDEDAETDAETDEDAETGTDEDADANVDEEADADADANADEEADAETESDASDAAAESGSEEDTESPAESGDSGEDDT